MTDFNTVLFSKKNGSTSKVNLTHEEVWDDSLLIRHYDEVKAKLDKKRRIKLSETSAADTESDATASEQIPEDVSPIDFSDPILKKKNKKKKSNKKREWQAGDYCRWRFSDDNMIYEANIVSVDNHNGTATIRYLGYDNEDIVTTRLLMRSLGQTSQRHQRKQAENEGYAANDSMFGGGSSVAGSEMMSDTDDRANKRQRNQPSPSSLKFPRMPPLPDLPPPPAIGLGPDVPNSEALHTMLMSWYMTGYHTGYYQGMQANSNKPYK